MKFKKIIRPFIALVLIVFIGALAITMVQARKKSAVNNFEECVAAGNPVMESYPEQCSTPDGKSFTKPVSGQSITVNGEVVCLPQKNTDGIQTLECAIGIQDSEGKYYALRDPSIEYGEILQTTGSQISVTGMLDTAEAASSKYAIVGTIQVANATKE